MNILSSFLLILLAALSFPSWAARSKGREFQSKILMMRVQEVLSYRKQGLELCLKVNKNYTSATHQRFNQDLKKFAQGKFSSNEKILTRGLEVLSLTVRHPHCATELRAADLKLKKLQQSKFALPMKTAKSLCLLATYRSETCLKNVTAILNELDPFCVTQNSENLSGKKDPNACMAGDRLLGKNLRQKNDPEQRKITDFLDDLEDEIDSSKKHATLDLWTLFLKNHSDNQASRKKFLSLMAFLYYSLGSAGGYVDGIADHYWMGALKDGQSGDDIFEEFYSMRQKLDRYRFLIRKKAAPKSLKFSFHKISMKGLNRHDFMAMFLACHFKGYGSLNAKIIPNILGFGYESLDMVSHLKGDVSIEESLKNFKWDTSRYTVGSTIGEGFCSLKI